MRGACGSTCTAPTPGSKQQLPTWGQRYGCEATPGRWQRGSVWVRVVSTKLTFSLMQPQIPGRGCDTVCLNLSNVTQSLQLPKQLWSKSVDQYLLLPHGKDSILSR